MLTQLRRIWITVSDQPLLAGAIIGMLPLAICISLAIFDTPVPVVHDEYSYLLAADTFLHGRLANPPHPMWVFFESFHINMLPAYVSKYPPMQGFALAFGQLISGQAIVGAWLSLAAGCVAVYWMLRGWIAPGWAFLGGLMVALNGMVIFSWGLSFWGGAMAMLGGALLYGSIVRLVKRPRLLEALLCGIGIGILAMSRPYEGMIASIPAAGYLFYGLFRNKEFSWKKKISAVILPIGLLLMLTASFMGYYNYRTTGDAAKFAYKVNGETYAATPSFFFADAPPAPEYRHPVMKNYYIGYALGTYMSIQSSSGFLDRQKRNFKQYWSFFSPSLLSIFVLGLPFALRERQFRFIFFCSLLFGLGPLLVVAAWPHYAAPFYAVIVLAMVTCFKTIWNWELRGRKIGSAVVVAVLVFSMVRSFQTAVDFDKHRDNFLNRHRNGIMDQLKEKGGKHLVFVRYSRSHNIHDEWVYNGADIDSQPVVWARHMNKKTNETLIDYYNGRQVWLLTPNPKQTAMMPYPR